jgi:hypothetical protein
MSTVHNTVSCWPPVQYPVGLLFNNQYPAGLSTLSCWPPLHSPAGPPVFCPAGLLFNILLASSPLSCWPPFHYPAGHPVRGGHAQLFFESAIAIPQLEGGTSAIAIPQLFKKSYSATATPQFCNRNFFGVRKFKSAT